MAKANSSGCGGLVVAPQAEAAHAGTQVLRAGGNAADALVTASLVQGVVDPHRCGIGGFGCSTVNWDGGRETLRVDFHGRAGSQARADQWTSLFENAAPDGFGYIVRGKVNDVGYQSITAPGMLAGLAALHDRFGKRPWKELVLRAAEFAEHGFLVTPPLADFWRRPGLFGRVSTLDRLGFTAAGREATMKSDGKPHAAGDVYHQPTLAATYRRLAEEGPESFYRGALAATITADWEKNGALLTAADLGDYAPEVGPPLAGFYRGLEIHTTPLPGGGVAVLQALQLLERLNLTQLGHNTSDYIETVAPILQKVWRDRLANQGDPSFGGKSAEELLAADYVGQLKVGSVPSGGTETAGTTQLTIVDDDENVISFAHSLGYGSGVFTPGLGFMFNNCMGAFDPVPGNRNSIAPGKARSTAVSETILRRDGRPFLVLGSPGAARITAALVQVIVDVVDFGMNVAEAVTHPRFDAYGEKDLLLEGRIPLAVAAAARKNGWNVIHSPRPFGVVGRVYAAQRRTEDAGGGWDAAVDPGEPGLACRA